MSAIKGVAVIKRDSFDHSDTLQATIWKTIQVCLPSSFVTVNVEFPDNRTLITGDVHDKPVPAAAAAKHTVIIWKMSYMNSFLWSVRLAALTHQ